jgi:hypothetical protein
LSGGFSGVLDTETDLPSTLFWNWLNEFFLAIVAATGFNGALTTFLANPTFKSAFTGNLSGGLKGSGFFASGFLVTEEYL